MKIANKIKTLLKKDVIVFLGEVHGTRETPLFLAELIKEISKEVSFTLALEIPHSQQRAVEQFVQTKQDPLSFFTTPLQDGRNSLAVLDFLKSLDATKIKVHCMDIELTERVIQQNREQRLAESILALHGSILVIVGSFHASTCSYGNIIPMAKIIKTAKSVYTIFLEPTSGSFYNFGIKPVSLLSKEGKHYNQIIDLGAVSPALIE